MSDTPIPTPIRQATPNNWSDGVVAILSKSGRAVGTGFVVSEEGLIATCAHVLADNVSVEPGDKVSIRFKANGQLAEATVTAWWRDKTSEDVAFLSLLVELPDDVVVLPLATPPGSLGQTLTTFGYPKLGLFDGIWGEGTALQLVNENGFSRLQLRSQEITHGFSGAPLYDKTRNCVVGMVQQGARPDRAGRLRDTTFATPAETLGAICVQIPLIKAPRLVLDVVAEPLPPCPYRGLFAFREEDKDLFFGREALTQQLANMVLRQRLVAVLGPSGSGKSSLVFAGLLPQLRLDPDWLIADFRPGAEPFKALAAALLPWLEPGLSETDRLVEINKLARALAEGDLLLADVLPRIGQKQGRASHCLLVADQFEELFTLCQDTKRRQAFLELLLATVREPGSPALTLVATLRADFMGQALAYRPLADALQDHTFMVGPMNAAELQAAIEQPALQRKVTFEPGLVARILEDVGDEPGNLPLLEFSLTRLWEESQKAPLTHQAYEAIGQVEGALANHANQVYERLVAEQKEQMRRVIVQLVQPGTGTEDTRRQATRHELGEVGWQLAQQLAGPETRLLVTSQDDSGQETVEVIHEALIQRWKPLQIWMEQDREFRSWQERLRVLHKQWLNNHQHEVALIRGYQLGEAERWLGERSEELSLDEQVFIKASHEHEEATKAERAWAEAQARSAGRLRWLAISLTIVGIIAIVASLVAITARSRAEANEKLAQTRASEASSAQATAEASQDESVRLSQQIRALQLAAQAELRLDDDPELALLLAVAAVNGYQDAKQKPLPEASKILYEILSTSLPLYGHTDGVTSASFSPDGQLVVTAGCDEYDEDRSLCIKGTARLWEATTGSELAVLVGHTAGVTSASFSPDGSRVVTASGDGTARLWEVATGAELAVLAGHTGALSSASFSPDGQLVVTAGCDEYDEDRSLCIKETARLWEAATGAELAVLAGHTDWVTSTSFSSDGERVVTASYDQTARLWDAATGAELAVLAGHTSTVTSASFSPDGQRVVTASGDGTARLWDAATGAELAVFMGHTGWVISASFSSDGERVVTASYDQTARLWDAATGAELAVLAGHTDGVTSASFSPDGQRVVTASGDGTARLWEAATGAELAVFTGHTAVVWSASFSRDGQRVVTASKDGTGRLWEATTGSELAVLSGHMYVFNSASFSPDGERVVTAKEDWTTRLWEATTGAELAVLIGHTAGVTSASFSPDGQRLVTASYDRTARLWEATTGSELALLVGHTAGVTSASFSPDGSRVVTASWDRTARLWDVATGAELAVLTGHTSAVTSASFSPDGQLVVTAGCDEYDEDRSLCIKGTARLWEAATGAELEVLTGHTGGVLSASFSRDGERVVTASEDGTARLWEAVTGVELAVLAGHTYGVTSASFSPDGQRVVTASWDRTARLWDVATGAELAVLTGHTSAVTSASFSPDGQRLVTASDDGTARLWDTETGAELAVLAGHTAVVRSASFSRDGQRLVTVSEDGTARIWRVLRYVSLEAMMAEAARRLSRGFTAQECQFYFRDDLAACPREAP